MQIYKRNLVSKKIEVNFLTTLFHLFSFKILNICRLLYINYYL